MTIQIINYGAFIRLVMDSNVFLLAKSQIKSVEVIRDDTVRINNGEGPLQEVLVKLSEVTYPAGLIDVAALRDAIAHMLDNSNQYEVEALLKMQAQIEELTAIKQLFNLWHSSLQIDMNFQQMQVNALVAINEKLQEAQEDNDKIIESLNDQTDELQEHTVQLTKLDTQLVAIKTIEEAALDKQEQIKVIAGLIQTVLADILNELKAQTSKLNTIDTTLNDVRTQNNTTHTKLDTHTQLLGEIKILLAG